jgi:IS30 family transposase
MAGRKFLTHKERFKIKQLREEEYSYRQIARIINRPFSTVYSFISRSPYHTNKIPVNVPDSVIDMYTKQRMSIRKIMAATGASYGGVHDKLHRNGVIMRRPGGRYDSHR